MGLVSPAGPGAGRIVAFRASQVLSFLSGLRSEGPGDRRPLDKVGIRKVFPCQMVSPSGLRMWKDRKGWAFSHESRDFVDDPDQRLFNRIWRRKRGDTVFPINNEDATQLLSTSLTTEDHLADISPGCPGTWMVFGKF